MNSIHLAPFKGQKSTSRALSLHHVIAPSLLPLCVIAEKLVQKKLEELQKKVDLDQNVEGAYLTHLLLSEKMTVNEILGSITELLLAGVDTVRESENY